MAEDLRLGVVGVGHFGRYHAEKMAAIESAQLVAVADIDRARAEEVGGPLGAAIETDHRALLGQVYAVSIAVPAAAHYAVTKDFLNAGVHVLVEKPLTEDIPTAKEITALAADKGLVLQVGQIERFSDVFRLIAPRISRPLYIESVRIAPFKPRGTDVSVVLDIMIHDIDVILALVDAPVTELDAVGAPVFSSSEDIANARLKFANGCVANVTASRVSLKTERKLRIFQPDAYLGVDYGDKSVRIVRKKTGGATPPTGLADFAMEQESYDESDALKGEIDAFVHAVRTGTQPPVTGEDGVRSLEIAIRIAESMRANRDGASLA
jgi:predicted dehydrogenase